MAYIHRLYAHLAALFLMTGGQAGARLHRPAPQPKPITEEQRRLFRDNRQLREFHMKGYKLMAYSKKDALTRLIHMGLVPNKKKKKQKHLKRA